MWAYWASAVQWRLRVCSQPNIFIQETSAQQLKKDIDKTEQVLLVGIKGVNNSIHILKFLKNLKMKVSEFTDMSEYIYTYKLCKWCHSATHLITVQPVYSINELPVYELTNYWHS